jgi:hypothetical protein
VSGFSFRQKNTTAITGADNSATGSMGTFDSYFEGWYEFGRIDLLWGAWQFLILSTEPVNPLYTGPYSVGPYVANTVVPSGGNESKQWGIFPSYANYDGVDLPTPSGSGSTCAGSGGPETTPQAIDPSGLWQGQLCGYGWASWSSLNVKANRSFTIEVTAEDEQGFASSTKSIPVIGVWRSPDPVGAIPTVASVTEGLNTASAGLTSLTVNTPPPGSLRLAIADQRGDGRPDYYFGARVLYADSVSPAILPAAGGLITITGMGFRPGNTVTVNGVAATVKSWTANTIIATVPASGSHTGLKADVAVHDISTGGTAIMLQALTYTAPPPEIMQLSSAPSGSINTGNPATTPLTIKILAADGVTPISGETVTFTASLSGTASAALFNCGLATCTTTTDATGTATTTVTPVLAGPVTLTATSAAGSSVFTTFTAIEPIRTVTLSPPILYLAANTIFSFTQQAVLSDNSAPVAILPVNWTGSLALTPSSPTAVTNTSGIGSIAFTAGPLKAGLQTAASACAWSNTVCATFNVLSVDASALQLQIISGANQSVASADTLGNLILLVTDPAGHAVAGAPVDIYQTLEPGVACPTHGRCPAQPIERQLKSTATSDANGLVTVTPLDQPSAAEITNIVVTAGTQGFVSLALSKGW